MRDFSNVSVEGKHKMCDVRQFRDARVRHRVMNYMLSVLTTTVIKGMKVANSLSELVRK